MGGRPYFRECPRKLALGICGLRSVISILDGTIARSSGGPNPSIPCDSDGLGPYLEGVEVQSKIGALISEYGVRNNSPFQASKIVVSHAQNGEYKKIGVRDFS